MLHSVDLLLKMQTMLYREFSNVIMSPFSLEILLFSIFSGVTGKCYEELSQCLFGKTVNFDEITESFDRFKAIMQHLNILKNSEFKLNNHIYVSEKFCILQSFEDFVLKNLNARVKQIDFADENLEVYNIIDQDIRNASCGRIKQVFKCVPTVSKLLLVSCITFQGELKHPPSKIYDAKFQNSEEANVRYTVHQNQFKFSDASTEFTYVELPYKNGIMNLCLILPNEGSSLRGLFGKINYDTLLKLFNSSEPTQVEVHIPVVKLQSNVDLAYIWQLSGICKPFEKENAELSKMSSNYQGLFLESVVTNSELNLQNLSKISDSIEKVQSPADVTATVSPSMVLNRPFIYFVNCNMNKMQPFIIFSGVVNAIEP